MMNKTVFVARETNGNSDVEKAFFDKEAAVKAAKDYLFYLVPSDRDKNTVSVESYTVAVEDGQTADEAFREAALNDEIGDAEEYEEVKLCRVDMCDAAMEDGAIVDGDEFVTGREYCGTVDEIKQAVWEDMLHECKSRGGVIARVYAGMTDDSIVASYMADEDCDDVLLIDKNWGDRADCGLGNNREWR